MTNDPHAENKKLYEQCAYNPARAEEPVQMDGFVSGPTRVPNTALAESISRILKKIEKKKKKKRLPDERSHKLL